MTELQRWLWKLMSEEAFMEKAQKDINASFEDFSLSDEEKLYLRDPFSKQLFIRPMITRSVLTKPTIVKTVRPSKIVISPMKKSAKLRSSIKQNSDSTETTSSRVDAILDDYFPSLTPQPIIPEVMPSFTEKADITIVGLGMRSLDQITREAQRAISKSNITYIIDNSFGIKDYLQSLCPKVVDLSDLYAEGKDRMITYKQMVRSVIDGAISESPVTFALYGHPTVFAYPPFVVHEMAVELGLSVRVLPGISSMDCIFADLMIDPATDGLQMFEATDLLLRRRRLSTDIQTLIWQIGALETALYASATSKPERFEGFTNYLKQFYPPDHPCTAIYCSDHPAIPSSVFKFELQRLPELAKEIHAGYSLFLPAAQSLPIVDYDLARKLESTEHLKEITQASS